VDYLSLFDDNTGFHQFFYHQKQSLSPNNFDEATSKQVNKQTNKQTSKQTNKQTNKQTKFLLPKGSNSEGNLQKILKAKKTQYYNICGSH
jgi:hypothetical protein